MACMRASTMGSLGTAKGRRSMMTQLSWSPCTSTALPEAGGAEEDGVGRVAELLEEGVARGGAVEEERIGEFGRGGGRGSRASARSW